VQGGAGQDLLEGGPGNDSLGATVGETGDDRLNGGDGNDLLFDCQGINDRLDGGPNADQCTFVATSTAVNCETITACP